MMRAILATILLVAVLLGGWLLFAPEMKPPPAPNDDPEGRVTAARARSLTRVMDHFIKAGVEYPPGEIFLRAFKREAELELWARSGEAEFQRIGSYAITYSSGEPGPKRREGDRQVPEGCYVIDRYNPSSLYHLSMRLNYPNSSDRILSDPSKPGFDIYIHGGDGSGGCLPLGDAGIEELYLMAADAKNRGSIPVHIFPARMAGTEWENFVAQGKPELVRFWATLQPVFAAFERTHRVPEVTVAADGSYQVKTGN